MKRLKERMIQFDGDYKNIPIIINNFNRLEYPTRLITSLEKLGYFNIHILDNNSTYPPLLDYYRNTAYTVHHLGKNLGHLALWKSGVFKHFKKSFYVYTDPDLEIVDECPADFMKYFVEVLQQNPLVQKIGLALKYNDLPAHFKKKEEVIRWEKNFYTDKFGDGLYRAHVDTTFALYRPGAKGGSHEYKLSLRTVFPYECRHLPWYENSDNPGEENLYYINSARTSTFWTSKK
jgi:hypothetical protein